MKDSKNEGSKSNALVVAGNYAITKIADAKEIGALLAEAAGPGGISNFDLDQLRIPAGGGLSWEIPTLDGRPLASQEIEGIIVHQQDARAYWRLAMEESGGSSPPDCTSNDARWGVGDPGGDCTACPLAQFGSDDKKRGQACKAIKILYLLTEESILPTALQVPPSGLKAARQYLIRLAGRGVRPHQVVTRIALEKTKNPDGIAYSRPIFSVAGQVDPSLRARIEHYAAAIREVLNKPITVPRDSVDREEAHG